MVNLRYDQLDFQGLSYLSPLSVPLLPQAGIVIGLVLNIYQKEEFKEISEILLTTIMGATIIHELAFYDILRY